MERLIEFEPGATRYVAWRPGEWLFYVSVEAAKGGAVELFLNFAHRESTHVMSPRWVTLALGDGVDVERERLDGSLEDATVWYEADEGSRVVLGFEMPEGARLQTFEEMSAAARAAEGSG